jgi:hypothetical protein
VIRVAANGGTAQSVRATAKKGLAGMLQSTTVVGRATGSVISRATAAIGCLAVAAIHIIDQRGVPGLKEPGYVQILYYILEVAGIVAAALLLTKYAKQGWVLVLGVAAGPIVGYILSRGPGLPNYHDDIGNWTEPLGVISLIVEGILLILAATTLPRRG